MPEATSIHRLLPCPFCESVRTKEIEIDVAMWAVVCESCQTIGPVARSEDMAADRWNRRMPE